jgi:hypothetical protein
VAIEMQPLAMPEVHSDRLWKHPSLEFWQTLTSWVETFHRHQGTCGTAATRRKAQGAGIKNQGTCSTNVQALKGRMFQLIIKAAARVETMWVFVDGLHYHMAWKLKHLLQ